MENLFKMEKFNIIEDEENYYFFRALNMADNQDLESGKITDENGKYTRIRTDRERYEENFENDTPKYNKNSEISLEQVYDHIKMHYRKDTNCISLSSNANISICYGREFYKDKYIMVKVPKKEFGEKVINAGQYLLEEINKKIDEYISSIDVDSKITETLAEIENSKTSDEIKKTIETRYTSKEKIDSNKAKMRKGISYKLPYARISSYQTLNEEQSLEKNKIVGKLTFLERNCGMPPVIPNTANNNLLVQTIGNAFSSLELIHNGDIQKENIIDVPKEIVDIFALLQQTDGQDKQIVSELKHEVIKFINEGKDIKISEDSKLLQNNNVRKNVTIEEMYELTNGKVEYGMANSIVKNMFYLAKAQSNAKELARILKQITGENPKYSKIIQYISNNGFEILPQIITRRNNKGVRISESVNLDLKAEEIDLIDKIKELSEEEQLEIIENGGLSNVRNIMSSTFSKAQKDEQIRKEEYYAEAIFSSYNWNKIGIEEFTAEERNNLLQKIENEYCVELYKKLEEQEIDINKIPAILLNMVTRKNNFEITEEDTTESIKEKRLKQYDKMIQENISELNEELSIERIERFLGYYDVEGTGIQLRPYQQRAVEKTEEIFEKERFASVTLPTGAGKSFVALSQLMDHKDEEILYLAPQNEILEQIKDYIIKYIHGPVNTLGRSKDDIIKDVFPNLKFCTYPSLLSKEAEEVINKEYKFIVLDELHRTGAKEWGDKLNTLIDNQPDSTKILGVTATPRRDADGKNMANEMAERLGYTNKDATSGKHVAMNMSLTNAIRMGLVVNPKLVSCEYTLKTDGSLEQLEERINQIEDVEQRNEKLEKYEKLKRNLDQAEGIEQILQSNVKQDGKYIVFLPIVDNIEDEDGNKIGRKKGKNKIEDYEKQIAEYFKDSNITPNFHSMLGEYGDKENARRLEEFQNANNDATEFMLVMNKANEGLHLDKLDGIIWLRPLDENSRILYLQQLGRCTYSEDPDNPTKDENRPVVIDLVNNTLKVNWNIEITEQDDIELLTIISDWVEKHDGTLPNINSTDKEETGYAAVLKEIQAKYKGYLENKFENLNENQIEEVKEILNLGALIDLWNAELPDLIIKDNLSHERSFSSSTGGPFELIGNLKDFVELENEMDEIESRTAIERFIEKLQKLQEIGVDVSRIVIVDTIQTLAKKSGIGIEKLQEIGLNPKDKIGNSKNYVTQAYRGQGAYIRPTEEQVKILLEMGISLDKQERNVIQEFIEKLQKLQEIGVDVSKIQQKDTVQTLAKKSGIDIEKLQEIGLNPKDKIGNSKQCVTRAYRGQGFYRRPTEEQVKILLKMGINLDKQNITQEFIEKLQKLQEIGVDVSKIKIRDTIQTLVKKSGIDKEQLKEIGLNSKDKIGKSKQTITQAYRGKVNCIKPTEEQVEILLEMGISLDKKNITGKEIAEATISSLTDIEMADREDVALKELVEKTKEGGIKRDE